MGQESSKNKATDARHKEGTSTRKWGQKTTKASAPTNQGQERDEDKHVDNDHQATDRQQRSSTHQALGKSPRGMTPGMFITQQEGVFSERYQGLKVLGKGSFGEVILCRDRSTGNECAVKVLSKKALKKGADPTSLLREVDLLKQLDHPNIMKLYEFFEDPGYFYLVGEVYSGGELFDEIISRKRLSEQDAARIMKQVLSGIAYMHNNKVVHRDLKPENLLLESKKKDAPIKIIDFGLSTLFESAEGKMRDKIGTAYYIAPEVLRGTYDEKCDVWSCGVILYILLSGCPPFYGSTETEILKRVEQGKYSFNLPQWRKVSEPAKSLIRIMLTFSPTQRCTALEALNNEWLQKMTESSLTELPALETTMLNMKQFQGTQKLANAALLYMGSKLTTAEEIRNLTAIFQRLDKNGDGQLDSSELKAGYVELMKLKGVDASKLDEEAVEAEVDNVLQNIDFDNNGFIEYSEFVAVTMGRKALMSEERLKRAFALFDVDGSGKISSSELLKIFQMSNVKQAEIEHIIAEADKNNDGEVDYEEFCSLLESFTAACPE